MQSFRRISKTTMTRLQESDSRYRRAAALNTSGSDTLAGANEIACGRHRAFDATLGSSKANSGGYDGDDNRDEAHDDEE